MANEEIMKQILALLNAATTKEAAKPLPTVDEPIRMLTIKE